MDHSQSHFNPKHYEGVASGPFSFLNPTTRRRKIPSKSSTNVAGEGGIRAANEPVSDSNNGTDGAVAEQRVNVDRNWRSRDNRKGRHGIVVIKENNTDAKLLAPQATNTLSETLKGIWRMFSTYPYWDVSYLVAVIFTLGSVVWVINSFFVWLPLQDPSTEFDGEISNGGGITAFLGATIFEVGSILLMIEAVNENRSDCFGWALEEALQEEGLWRLRPNHENCRHHHSSKHNLVGHDKASEDDPSDSPPAASKDPSSPDDSRKWTWFPTWHELTSHYFHELGFLACLAQFIGASIFWISGFTALPGIQNNLSQGALYGCYWAVQVIGGTGFIVSGILFMLETQQKWYLPAPKVLGWHIGLWNLIGALGFTLCGALGFSSGDEEIYQSSLATFWGSWAFLIGSCIQWFESLDKHPVDVEEGGGRVADTKPVYPKPGKP